MADKVLVATALIMLIPLGRLPAWLALLILCREMIVTGLRGIAASSGIVVPASGMGKIKSVVQYVGLGTLIFPLDLLPLPFLHRLGLMIVYVALVLTIWSGIDYFLKLKDLFLAPPGSRIGRPGLSPSSVHQLSGTGNDVSVSEAAGCRIRSAARYFSRERTDSERARHMDKIHQGDGQPDLDGHLRGGHDLQPLKGQFLDRDDRDDRGILDGIDEFVGQGRKDPSSGLGQNDVRSSAASREKPRAWDASHCPFSTDSIPALIISAI